MGAVLHPASNTLSTLAAAINSTAIAGEAVKAGDVLVQASDGKLYWVADQALAGSYSRPLYQAADAYFPQPNKTVNVLSGVVSQYDSPGFSMVLLDDGSYLEAVYTAQFSFAIFNADGTVKVARQTLGSVTAYNTSMLPLAAKKMANGNVFLLFGNDTSVKPAYAIVSPKGDIVKAATYIETTANMVSGDAVVVPNGNIAVAYFGQPSGSSTYVGKVVVIGPDGSIVKAVTQLASTASGFTMRSIAVAAGTDGTFAVAWYGSGGYVQRFSGTGDSLGSAVQLTSGAASQQRIQMVALTAGGYGIAYCTDSANSGASYLYVYSGTLALVKSVYMNQLASNSSASYNPMDLTATADGGVAAIWLASDGNNQFFSAARITATGAVAVAPGRIATQFSTPSANYQIVRIAQIADPSGHFVATYTGNAGTVIMQLDSLMIGLRETVYSTTPASGGAYIIQTPDPVNPNVQVLNLFFPSSSVGVCWAQILFYTRARNPVGVAVADAAKDAPVEFTIIGTAVTRITFAKAAGCDVNNAFGQRMSLVGNKAVMKGVQA